MQGDVELNRGDRWTAHRAGDRKGRVQQHDHVAGRDGSRQQFCAAATAPPTAPPPTAPPPTTPPPTAPPPTTPPPTTPPPTRRRPAGTTPPAPPSNPSPATSVTILSPSSNAVIKGIVPVFVAIPAQTEAVHVHLKNAWGETVNKWQVPVTPSASSTTVQVNAEIGDLPNASYSLIAMAFVAGVAVTSDPVPVRVENTTVTPPPPAPPQTPTPGSPTTPRLDAGRAPSRIKSPTAGVVPDLTTGGARPRPQAQPAATSRAERRTSSSTSSCSQGWAQERGRVGQQDTEIHGPEPRPRSTSLPAGTIVTIGLGSMRWSGPVCQACDAEG